MELGDKLEYQKTHKALKKDLTGQRFGRLEVLGFAERRKNGQAYWKCRCDCGRETIVRQGYLESGKTKSCGCLRAQTGFANMQFVDGTSIVRLMAAKNNRVLKNNKSGYNGVYLNKKNRKWIAQITFKGKTYYLGAYARIEEAVKARKTAEDKIYGGFLEWYEKEKTSQDIN